MSAVEDLPEFLLARIAEDEEWARVAQAEAPTPWRDDGGTLKSADGTSLAGYAGEWASPHIARHDPARVLAECEAKRGVVDLALEIVSVSEQAELDAGRVPAVGGLGDVLRLLALPYADHPDYQQEWRP